MSLIQNWKQGQEDMELLELLASEERKKVAQDLHITLPALTKRIARIRKRLIRYRWYVKTTRDLVKREPYIQRLLLPTKPQEQL